VLDGLDSTDFVLGSDLTSLETDPTVVASVKDGVSWGEIASIPADILDGDDGIISEADPTVPENIKDGLSWGEITEIPSGFADGVDDTGVLTEADPTVPESVKDGVDFSEVTGAATDAQIPDDITINHAGTADSATYAATAGDADTVDGKHANDIESKTLLVVDEMDEEVGRLISSTCSGGPCEFQVFNEVTGWIFTIQIHQSTPEYRNLGNIAFESTDCTGQAYTTPYYTIGQLLYHHISDKHFSAESYVKNKETHSRFNAASQCYLNDAVWNEATALQEIADPLPTFTPPYHVELR